MGWIDAVVIGLVVISALIGLSRGFFDSILAIIGSVMSLFLAIWASKPTAKLINSVFNADGFFAEKMVKWGWVEAGQDVNIFIGKISIEEAAKYLTLIASAVLIYILIKFVIFLLAKLFDSATQNNTALSGINRLLGLVFGAAKGLFFVAVAFLITGLVSQIAFTQTINDEMSKNTVVASKVYGYINDQQNLDKIKDFIGDFITKSKSDDNQNNTTPPIDNNQTGGDQTGGQAGGQTGGE